MTTSKETNKWKFSIEIKHLLTETDSPQESVNILCISLISQLELVKEKLEKDKFVDSDVKETFIDNLNKIIDNFQFLKNFTSGEILMEAWEDYNFNSEWEEWFDGYLAELYDLGDTRIVNKNNTTDKFLWVG